VVDGEGSFHMAGRARVLVIVGVLGMTAVAMVVAPGWEHAQVPVGSDVVTARRPRAGGPRAGRARTAHPERRTPVVQVFRSVSRWFQ
jgi:hypothetical protein